MTSLYSLYSVMLMCTWCCLAGADGGSPCEELSPGQPAVPVVVPVVAVRPNILLARVQSRPALQQSSSPCRLCGASVTWCWARYPPPPACCFSTGLTVM